MFGRSEGYGAGSSIWRTSLFSKDAPIPLSIVDTEEQITRLVPVLDRVVGEGVIASSPVEAMRYMLRKA